MLLCPTGSIGGCHTDVGNTTQHLRVPRAHHAQPGRSRGLGTSSLQQLVASTAMASISGESTSRMKQQDPHWLGWVDGSWDASGSGSLEAHREVKE